jgi:hypothetical protein
MDEEIVSDLREMEKFFYELQNKYPLFKKWLPTVQKLIIYETRRDGI